LVNEPSVSVGEPASEGLPVSDGLSFSVGASVSSVSGVQAARAVAARARGSRARRLTPRLRCPADATGLSARSASGPVGARVEDAAGRRTAGGAPMPRAAAGSGGSGESMASGAVMVQGRSLRRGWGSTRYTSGPRHGRLLDVPGRVRARLGPHPVGERRPVYVEGATEWEGTPRPI